MARLDLGKVKGDNAKINGYDTINITNGNDIDLVQDNDEFTIALDTDLNDLTNYELKSNTGSTIELSINSSTYVMTLNLKNSDGTVISTDTIDLPLESVVVGGSYDKLTKEVVLTLEGGTTIRFSIADLVSGLYSKPATGIPKSDLASDVQTSLGKADSALQEHQDISGKEDKSNKVTSMSSSSTHAQYPSAKTVYDALKVVIGENTYSTNQEWANFLQESLQSALDDIWEEVDKKYVKPSAGIPKTDLSSDVQDILDNAGGGGSTEQFALVSGTDLQYSYLTIDDVQTIINELNNHKQERQTYIKMKLGNTYQTCPVIVASLNADLSTTVTTYNLLVWICSPIFNGLKIDTIFQNYRVVLSWDNDIPTVTSSTRNSSLLNNIFMNGNTAIWTPSTNYSPVHKKYVDELYKSYTGYDATKTQILKNINGTLTWVDET